MLPSGTTKNPENGTEVLLRARKPWPEWSRLSHNLSTERSKNFRKKLKTTKIYELTKAKEEKCQPEQYGLVWPKRENNETWKLRNKKKEQQNRENNDKDY